MNNPDAFARILASLYDAMLDETRWPATSALSTRPAASQAMAPWSLKARRTTSGLSSSGSTPGDSAAKTWSASTSKTTIPSTKPSRGNCNCPPASWCRSQTCTHEELKTSPTYNELLRRAGMQDSLNVRLPGLDGSHIGWGLNDPVDSDGWGSSRITMVQRLLPHIQQFVRVRQALVRAEARSTTVTALLDNPRIGVLELDRRGRILAENDRARSILRHGDGLLDRNGMLRARAPADQVRLERLVGVALPASGAVAVSGSMVLRRSSVVPPFVVPVKPVGGPQPPDHGARHVAALVLIVEPGRQHRINSDLVATTLELTPAETQVAVWLAEGNSVRDMADATGHTKAAIYWHLQRIYQKHSISRQADLVRLVLSLAELG